MKKIDKAMNELVSALNTEAERQKRLDTLKQKAGFGGPVMLSRDEQIQWRRLDDTTPATSGWLEKYAETILLFYAGKTGQYIATDADGNMFIETPVPPKEHDA